MSNVVFILARKSKRQFFFSEIVPGLCLLLSLFLFNCKRNVVAYSVSKVSL